MNFQNAFGVSNVFNTGNFSQQIYGPHRVLPGRLSVTRTFGDIEAKLPQFGGNPNVVIAKPDIKEFDVQDNFDFILLASDGIFDKLSTKESIESIWYQANSKKVSYQSVHEFCGIAVDTILKFSLGRKTMDNITVVVIGFDNLKRQLFPNSKKDNKLFNEIAQPSILTKSENIDKTFLDQQQQNEQLSNNQQKNKLYFSQQNQDKEVSSIPLLTLENKSISCKTSNEKKSNLILSPYNNSIQQENSFKFQIKDFQDEKCNINSKILQQNSEQQKNKQNLTHIQQIQQQYQYHQLNQQQKIKFNSVQNQQFQNNQPQNSTNNTNQQNDQIQILKSENNKKNQSHSPSQISGDNFISKLTQQKKSIVNSQNYNFIQSYFKQNDSQNIIQQNVNERNNRDSSSQMSGQQIQI